MQSQSTLYGLDVAHMVVEWEKRVGLYRKRELVKEANSNQGRKLIAIIT